MFRYINYGFTESEKQVIDVEVQKNRDFMRTAFNTGVLIGGLISPLLVLITGIFDVLPVSAADGADSFNEAANDLNEVMNDTSEKAPSLEPTQIAEEASPSLDSDTFPGTDMPTNEFVAELKKVVEKIGTMEGGLAITEGSKAVSSISSGGNIGPINIAFGAVICGGAIIYGVCRRYFGAKDEAE